MKIVAVGIPEPRHARWPEHLPVGALRVVRWSARYDETVVFYREPAEILIPLKAAAEHGSSSGWGVTCEDVRWFRCAVAGFTPR
jgi:hypothetical protein